MTTRILFGKTDPFVPQHIPRSLKYAEFDLSRSDIITLNGGNIETLTDPISGGAFTQAVAGSRPLYEAAGFNGYPCASWDGTDDYLRNTTATATLGYPTSGAFEIWVLFQFLGTTALSGDIIFNYPAESATTLCSIATETNSGGRRARFRVTTGAAQITATTGLFTDINGRQLIRCVSDGANIRVDLNGVEGTAVACVPSLSGGPRHTLGATAASGTPTNYQFGRTQFLGFYKPLPTIYSDALYAHLNTRKG